METPSLRVMARPATSLLLIWIVLTLSSPVTGCMPRIASRHSIGNTVETYIKTTGAVYHMELDKQDESRVIFSDTSSLRITDGATITTIAGRTTRRNSVAEESLAAENPKFRHITGFYQLDEVIIIIADHLNNCLRQFSRETGETTVFAGTCGRFGGYRDASLTRSLFNRPYAVNGKDITISQGENQTEADIEGTLYVTDTMNDAIRSINMARQKVKTLIRSQMLSGLTTMLQLGEATFIPVGSTIYELVDSQNGLVELMDTWHNNITLEDPKAMLMLAPLYREYNYQVLAIDGNQLKAFGLNMTAYQLEDTPCIDGDEVCELMQEGDRKLEICTGVPGNSNGDIETCELDRPKSLLLHDNTIYIGQHRAIRKIEGLTIGANKELSSPDTSEPERQNRARQVKQEADGCPNRPAPGLTLRLTSAINPTSGSGKITRISAKECPSSISGVAHPVTGWASLDIDVMGVKQRLLLPAGRYPYQVEKFNNIAIAQKLNY